MDAAKIEAAAKAAYPEFWPAPGETEFIPADWTEQQKAEAKVILASRRTEAVNRIAKAFAAVPPGDIELPSDAVMLEQTLMAFTYLDKEGRVMYGMRTIGETSLTTWLGLAELAKHYLLQMNARPWEERNS